MMRAITCPACGGTIQVRAAGWSVSLACLHCGSALDVTRPEVQLIERYTQAAAGFALELGKRGGLFGEEWELVGALARGDDEEEWHEYLLLNPYLGYRWLIHWQGRWQWGEGLLGWPSPEGRDMLWNGAAHYPQGAPATITTRAVLGEFPWRVRAGDRVSAQTFAQRRGKASLSWENDGSEDTWTHLVPLDGAVVAAAFGLPGHAPDSGPRRPGFFAGLKGRFARRPDTDEDDLVPMAAMAMVTLAAIFFVMSVMTGPASRASGHFSVPLAEPARSYSLGTITVARGHQMVTIQAATNDFENRWIDLDYSLVDRATQQSIDAYGLAEYYTGTDSDGRWSEGSHEITTVFSAVPRGTYDVMVDAAAHAWPSDPASGQGTGWESLEGESVWVETFSGGFSWGLFWTFALLILPPPIAIFWWRHRG